MCPARSGFWPNRPATGSRQPHRGFWKMLKKTSDRRPRSFRRTPSQYIMVNQPEHLVDIGFRCWLAGYDTGDINCWEAGWNQISRALGPARAKPVVTELACWVRTIHAQACRKIQYYPVNCAGFCRDECMAISMIAASQHNACPALRACAFALIGESHIDPVIEASEEFAGVLHDVEINLRIDSIAEIAGILDTGTTRLAN